MTKVVPRRILIIDDNATLAENIAEILAMDGHVTEIAASAEEAMAKMAPNRPDVVVTDYRLPGMDGASLLRELRKTGLRVVAIVISAYSDSRTINDARSTGATFVPKPVDFGILGRLIRDEQPWS
jgi:DNA-binding NtrC family response regulator